MRSLNLAIWVCCGAVTFGCGGNEAAKSSDTTSVAGRSGGGSGAGSSRAGETSVDTTAGGASANGGSATTGSATTACADGTERCDCYGNGTCNAGLTCASGLCVVVGVISTSGGATSVTSAGGSANAGAPTSGSAVSGGTASGGAASGGAMSGGTASGGTTLLIGGDALAALFRSCGNSKLDANEQCDDGNIQNGDGCTRLCQVELDWVCSEAGRLCVPTVVCGDGKLASVESCDDGNTTEDDGCSADCKAVADGYQCRTPGKRCVPICGDSKITSPESCDDGNSDSGDGCSGTCLTEPGFSCVASPSSCRLSVCGNGVKEPGEACDKGEANGLFYADGQGCSKTCTQEPNCRPGGVTQACSTVCGDGNVDLGEECDDGNAAAGDGCSSTCKAETGFACSDAERSETQTCSSGSGQCLALPVIYRDFDGQNLSSGHPDFFYMGATATGGTKTVCVPNASSRTQVPCSNYPRNDATPLCLGLTQDTLDANGKPVANTARNGGLTCECQFTDWDQTGILDSINDSTITHCNLVESGDIRSIKLPAAPIIQSATSFTEWYRDSVKSNRVVSKLELAQFGPTNQFRFDSSGGRTVNDDLHDIFLRRSGGVIPEGAVTSLSSGFFPLESNSRAKTCNLWPYWTAPATCNGSDWDAFANNGLGSTVSSVPGVMRNFYFTSEVRYLFKYAGGETIQFFGDDDLWIYVNGRLVLDLGATHERLQGSITLTSSGSSATVAIQNMFTGAFIPVGTAQNRIDLGLEVGKIYEIAVFHADRQPRESNYQLAVPGYSKTRSTCSPRCGDGVITSGEECDDGANNKPESDAYGACTTACKLGPYCGDGEVTGAEACDNGVRNGAPYGTLAGCTNGCEKVHYCGDRIIDGAFDEECDGGAGCAADCKLVLSGY